MAIAYLSQRKISDCVGRSSYILGKGKEELIGSFCTNDDPDYWKKLQNETEERACNELILMFPLEYQNNKERCLELAKEYANKFHEDNGVDVLIGVHSKKGNLHAHMMYNERRVIDLNNSPEKVVKKTRARYKVDGKYVTKKQYDEAIANGNDNVEYIPKKEIEEIINKRFTIKDKKFESKEWLEETKKGYVEFLNSQKDKEREWKIRPSNLHIPEKHVGKGNTEAQKKKKEYNKVVKEWNKTVDEALTKQVPPYMIKEEKDACKTKNKLNLELLRIAINKIKDTVKFVYNKLLNGLNKILDQEKAIEPLKKDYLSIKDKLFVSKNKKDELFKKVELANKELVDRFNEFKENNPILFKLLKNFNANTKLSPSICLDYLNGSFRSDYTNEIEPKENDKEMAEKGRNKGLSYIKSLKNELTVDDMLKEINDEIDNFYDLDEIIGNNSFEKRTYKRKRDDYER